MPAFSRRIITSVLSALSKCRNSASDDAVKVAIGLTRCRQVPLADVSMKGVPPGPGRELVYVECADRLTESSAVRDRSIPPPTVVVSRKPRVFVTTASWPSRAKAVLERCQPASRYCLSEL